MRWLRRVLLTFRMKAHRHEMEEEVRFHLSMREQRNLDEGMSGNEAYRRARVRFGNPVVWLERMSEVEMHIHLRSVIEDLRFGFRQLVRNPVFTITAVLTLALGIGINTTIFSVADAVLLKPLPWPEAGRMVAIYERMPKFGVMNDSWPDYVDWRSQNSVFAKMAALQPSSSTVNLGGEDRQIPSVSVTNSFFDFFGANPSIGRAFTSQEAVPGSGLTAVVSYAFWRQFLGGERSAVGRSIQVDGQAATVVGVLPPDFSIPYGRFEIYLPFGVETHDPEVVNRANHPGLSVVAVLQPGVTLAAARTNMGNIMQRLSRSYPQSNRDETAVVMPLRDHFVGGARNILLLLLSATGLVLVLACANIANMSLARSTARQREFALRLSLGASRSRLFRQALIENLPLALFGGASGIGLSALIMHPLIHFYPHRIFGLENSHLNGAVLCFAAAVCIASWLLFGIVPAVAVSRRTDAYRSIRTTAPDSHVSGHTRLRSSLLVAEIAIAVVVTVSTGLVLRSLLAVTQVDPGFRADHLLVLESVHAESHGAAAQNVEFFRDLLARLRQLPGVESVSAAMELPLRGVVWTSPYVPDGHPQPPDTQQPWTEINFVMPGYFQTMGMRMLSGRFFSETDASSAPVAVINETMARSIGVANPVGRQLYVAYAPHAAMEIVGVVAGEKQFGLDRRDMPEVYIPATQAPVPVMDIVLRTSSTPESLANAAGMTVHDLTKSQPEPRALAMETFLNSDLADRKFVSLLLGLFDALAVILALVGVAGVVSYMVEQRTHEIGVRMALGATRTHVMNMILFGQCAKFACLGVAIGIACAFVLTRLLANQLYAIKPSDPLTFAVASMALIAVTLLASYLPARRAIMVDPAVALRCE
ncbi:MAG: ABC transporter permease [Acidobacteriaceae bacterium]